MAGIDAFNVKIAQSVLPQSINNANIDGTAVDCKGYAFALGVVALGAAAGNLDVVKVQESDDNSAWSDVSGLSFTALGTSDDNKHVEALIDLRGRKRYLRWHISEDNTGATLAAGFFALGGASETPVTTTDRGSDEILSA